MVKLLKKMIFNFKKINGIIKFVINDYQKWILDNLLKLKEINKL